MKKAHYSILINAPREKVWQKMLDDATYRIWTEPFAPGCYYEGSWEKGSKILFLAPGEDGKNGGMVSRIADNRPHEFMSIEHRGIVQDGVEDTTSEAATKWTPAFENYTFKTVDGMTQLDVEMDIAEEYEEMFADMWPKALARLKEISER